jgi:hypothetical protein
VTDADRREQLKQLDEQLARIDPADEHGQQLIANARADIQRALDQSDEDESLVERLNEMIYHFEGTHPDLALTLNTIITSLSNMGL